MMSSGYDRSTPVESPLTTKPRAQERSASRATIRRAGEIYRRAGHRLAAQDWTLWALLLVAVVGLGLRLYGIDWDANNHLHPDERQIVFKAMCLTLPGTPRLANCDPAYTGPGWFFSPSSPLNPHFFAYGTFPQYLLAAVARGLAWLGGLTGGRFAPPDGGTWDDFDHFTLVGRALSALFDIGSIVLAGLLGRRLAGRWAGLLAAALVALTPLEVQLAHFYAVDTLLLFFVLLTLLGCVMLAQMARTEAQADNPVPLRAWRVGLLIGVGLGLALATKVSALPLLVPVGVALLLTWCRWSLQTAVLAGLGIAAAAVIAFVLTSPYALIDWQNFQAQVNEQTALSQGKLDYPYVRQFAGTTPYLYPLRQLLLFDMGVPLALLALAGFIWAITRVWRRLDDDWIVLVSWIAVYFAIVGGAYTKFSRYMLPIMAPLAICGAATLCALLAWGSRRIGQTMAESGDESSHRRRDLFATSHVASATRRWGAGWWRAICAGLALVVLAGSGFLTLALLNVYSAPNTRVQASEWIYDHIPAGAVFTSEVWDDPLPIQVPAAHRNAAGSGMTAAGHAIDPGQYPQIGLNLYDPDTLEKAQQLADSLSNADVVVISSQRLLRSIPKLPDRYPLTTRYYDLLFAGTLGFHLAAHFEAHPHLLGFRLDDTTADESFSVYDHPPVWIFARAGAGLNAQQLDQMLTHGLQLPAVSNRPGNEKSLLLDPADAAQDSQSPSLADQFPPNSLPNRIPLLWWLIVVELLGLIGFPLAYVVFPGLHDRGWGLSKTLALLVLAYLTWLPASLRVVPFTVQSVLVALVVLALGAGALAWWRWQELWGFVRARWRLLVVCEAAFLAAFLFFVWIRALDPDLWHIYRGGEKPMELAFLNAILRSRTMPPYDPWFAGGYINYYYYGQYLVAVLVRLTGIAPTTAFNLAIPLIFALTFTGAFSIVAGLTRRWWAGLAGGVALVVVGNLDGALQLLDQVRATLAHQVPLAFDYWRSSRVIPFTINEFPYWSFLYADLHAHVIDLPVVLLVVGACASLLNSGGLRRTGWLRTIPTLAAIALALGAAWCINTWDVPTYGALAGVAVVLWLLPLGRGSDWRKLLARLADWRTLRGLLLALGLTFGAAYALYLPFHASFQNFVSGTGPVTTPTDPGQLATLFGLWLFLVASFFFAEIHDRWERWRAESDGNGQLGRVQRLFVLLLVSGVTLLIAYRLGVKWLLLVLIATGIWLVLSPRHGPLKLMTYLLVLLGLAVALAVEIVYVRDFLDNSDWERMNTVFKFYYQVWLLLALGGALIFAQLAPRVLAVLNPIAERGERERSGIAQDNGGGGAAAWATAPGVGGILRGAWVVALLVLLAGSSVFLVEGTRARVQDPQVWAAVQPPPGGVQPQGLSLDGMAYVRGWYPGDYAAINWMNAHIAGDPTIVEASNGPYAWYGRVSIYTGLPSVLGWGSHEAQQRYPDEVYVRQGDVQTFYSTTDPVTARDFLQRYGVRYVYLGQLERTCFATDQQNECMAMPSGALAKFDVLKNTGVLRVVYDREGVTIYQVVG
jgi:YYY domain-containing protein